MYPCTISYLQAMLIIVVQINENLVYLFNCVLLYKVLKKTLKKKKISKYILILI